MATIQQNFEEQCKILTMQCEELEKANKDLSQQLEEMKSHMEFVEAERNMLRGRIQGLEFAIRCNGVSGAEVR